MRRMSQQLLRNVWEQTNLRDVVVLAETLKMVIEVLNAFFVSLMSELRHPLGKLSEDPRNSVRNAHTK